MRISDWSSDVCSSDLPYVLLSANMNFLLNSSFFVVDKKPYNVLCRPLLSRDRSVSRRAKGLPLARALHPVERLSLPWLSKFVTSIIRATATREMGASVVHQARNTMKFCLPVYYLYFCLTFTVFCVFFFFLN